MRRLPDRIGQGTIITVVFNASRQQAQKRERRLDLENRLWECLAKSSAKLSGAGDVISGVGFVSILGVTTGGGVGCASTFGVTAGCG